MSRLGAEVGGDLTGVGSVDWPRSKLPPPVGHGSVPTSMIREAFQDLKRVRQIAVIAARHGFADVVERGGLWAVLGGKESVELSPEARAQSGARRFRSLLAELGPTFVKLGQVLSTRADLLPAEVVEELGTLQDQVGPIDPELVRTQIETSLGKPLTELYAHVEREPLASASIAQVHRARTIDGREVVVKVQRPNIAEQIRSDLSVLRALARALEAVVEEVGVYTPTGIIEEFDRAIVEELDFEHEAGNIRAFHRNHEQRPRVRVPLVIDALTTKTVLTMEFLEGAKLSQAQLEPAAKESLARLIVDTSFRQLFEDGLFHGDPHPGNLLVLNGGDPQAPTLALIDFGLVGRLTRPMQEQMVQLVLAVALKDSDSVARMLYRIGAPGSRANLVGFKADIDAILGQYLPTQLKDIDAKQLLRDLLDLAVKYKIRIPREYAILSRASVATEGILRSLYPGLNIGEVALPHAKKLLQDRVSPGELEGGLWKTVLRLSNAANELPTQLSQLMLDLEAGKLAITVQSEQMTELNRNLRSLAMVAFVGLCACGFIVGAFISFARADWNVAGVPLLGVLGVVAAGFLFGAASAWYLVAPRMQKVSLAKWLGRRPR